MLPALAILGILTALKGGADIYMGQKAAGDAEDRFNYDVAQNEKISRVNRRNAIGRQIGAISPMPQKWEAPPKPTDLTVPRILGGVAGIGSDFIGGMDATEKNALNDSIKNLYGADANPYSNNMA